MGGGKGSDQGASPPLFPAPLILRSARRARLERCDATRSPGRIPASPPILTAAPAFSGIFPKIRI